MAGDGMERVMVGIKRREEKERIRRNAEPSLDALIRFDSPLDSLLADILSRPPRWALCLEVRVAVT